MPSGRDYYKLFAAKDHDQTPSEAVELLNPNNAPTSPDQSITAFSLANVLGIPTEDLPCIVVNKGFQLNQFHCSKPLTLTLKSNLLGLDISLFEAKNQFPLLRGTGPNSISALVME